METFRSVSLKASLLWPWPKRRQNLRITTYESSLLNQLPPELISHITSFLPPVSAALFSLTCHYILFVLGTGHIKALKESTIPTTANRPTWTSYINHRRTLSALDRSSQRFQCLSFLERDLPDHLACIYCERLHPICHASVYVCRNNIGRATSPKCAQASRQMLLWLVADLQFNVSVFQMAMKRYYQGQEYLSLLNLLSGEREYTFQFFTEHQMIQFRVVSGSLLLRKQVQFTIFQENSSQEKVFQWKYVTVAICQHSGTISSESSQDDLHHFNAILRRAWLDWKRFKSSRELSRCIFCATEVQIDFQSIEENGIKVCVSIWKDLGSGSLHDTKWLRHLLGAEASSWEISNPTGNSLRATFECPANSEGNCS